MSLRTENFFCRSAQLSLLLFSFYVCIFVCPAADAKAPGWFLQQHFADWGNLDVLVFKDCARVTDPLRSWVMSLSKNGSVWQVTVFSPERKTIAICPLANFRRALGERLGIMTASDVNPAHWKKVGPDVINGIKVTRFDQTVDESDPRPASARYFLSTDVQTDPQVVKFICKVYDVPNLGLVPLRCTKRKIDKNKLNTLSVKAATYKPDDFAAPKGFKTKTLEEVMFANTSFY